MSRNRKEFETVVVVSPKDEGGVKLLRLTKEEAEKLNNEFDSGGKKSEEYGKKVKGAGDDVSKFGNIAKGAFDLVVKSAAAVFTAITGIVVVNTKLVAETHRTAQALGVSTQSFQAQAHAAKMVGLDTQGYGDVLRDVTVRVRELATIGTGEAQDFFDAMNLNVKDFADLAPDQLVASIGLELEKLNRNDRLLFLDQLGSDNATKLVDVIGHLDAMEQEAITLGIALSDVDAENINQAAIGIEKAQSVLGGVANEITAQFAPIVTDLTDRFYQAALGVGGAGDAVDVFVEGSLTGIGFVADVVNGLGILLKHIEVGWLGIGSVGTQAMANNSAAVSALITNALTPFTFTLGEIADGWGAILFGMSQLGGPFKSTLLSASDTLSGFSRNMKTFKIDATEILDLNAATQQSLIQAQAELRILLDTPPPSDKLDEWYEEVTARAIELSEATIEANASGEDSVDVMGQQEAAVVALIDQMEFENTLIGQTALQQKIATALRQAGAAATDEQKQAITSLITERYQESLALEQIKEQEKLYAQVRRNEIENFQRNVADLAYQYSIGEGSVKGFWDTTVDGIRRAASEWASSGITNWFFGGLNSGGRSGSNSGNGGLGSGGFNLQSLAGLASGIGFDGIADFFGNGVDSIGSLFGFGGSSSTVPGVDAGSDAWGSFYGGESSSPSAASSVGTLLQTALYGAAGGFAGGAIGEATLGKTAESSIGQTSGTILGSIIGGPIGAGIGAAIGSFGDVLFGGDGQKRVNLGFQFEPSVKDKYTFGINQFDSGLSPEGVNRRGTDEAAGVIIDQFRKYDSFFTQITNAAGIEFDYSGEQFTGIHGDAGHEGEGGFFGLKGFNSVEEAESALAAQHTKFVKDLIYGVSDSLSQDVLDAVANAAQDADSIMMAYEEALALEARTAEELIEVEEELTRVREESISRLSASINEAFRQQTRIQSLAASIRADLGFEKEYGIGFDAQIDLIEDLRQSALSAYQEQVRYETDLHSKRVSYYELQIDIAERAERLNQSLDLSELSPLSATEKEAVAKDQFYELSQNALNSSEDYALFEQATRTYLQIARQNKTGSDEYEAIYNNVQGRVDAIREQGLLAESPGELTLSGATASFNAAMEGIYSKLSALGLGEGEGDDSDENAEIRFETLMQNLLTGLKTIENAILFDTIEQLIDLGIDFSELPENIGQMLTGLLGAELGEALQLASNFALLETSLVSALGLLPQEGDLNNFGVAEAIEALTSLSQFPSLISVSIGEMVATISSGLIAQGAAVQSVADTIAAIPTLADPLNTYLGENDLGQVSDYQSKNNPTISGQDIRDYAAELTSQYSADEAAAIFIKAAQENNVGSKQVADALSEYGFTQNDVLDYASRLGLPSFALGTDGLGSDGPILAHKGEIIMEPDRSTRIRDHIESQVFGSSDQDMAAAVRDLSAKVGQLSQASRVIQLTVVTPDGEILKEQTITDIKQRSRNGEIIVHVDGIGEVA